MVRAQRQGSLHFPDLGYTHIGRVLKVLLYHFHTVQVDDLHIGRG
jgi:hypothetical protein